MSGEPVLDGADSGSFPTRKRLHCTLFVLDSVEPGSVVVTDGFASYPPAIVKDYLHRPFRVARSGVKAHVPLPGVHRVASLVRRWLLGTTKEP